MNLSSTFEEVKDWCIWIYDSSKDHLKENWKDYLTWRYLAIFIISALYAYYYSTFFIPITSFILFEFLKNTKINLEKWFDDQSKNFDRNIIQYLIAKGWLSKNRSMLNIEQELNDNWQNLLDLVNTQENTQSQNNVKNLKKLKKLKNIFEIADKKMLIALFFTAIFIRQYLQLFFGVIFFHI